MIDIYLKHQHIASFIKDDTSYLIDYKNFEIFLPEGYLYEIFKNRVEFGSLLLMM